MAKNSKEFEEKAKIQEIQRKNDLTRHENSMKELVYRRESEEIFHEHGMTRQRIKSAEIRKQQERKEFAEMRRH